MPPVRSLTDRAANGFDFNVLGGRIPAIVVSPHIRASSVVRRKGQQEENEGRETTAGFDHTSIIRTVWKVFELDKGPNGRQSLTLRDLHAPDLMHVIQPATVNDIGCFDGQIVAGPRALNFVHHHDWPGDPTPQFVLASAGPDAPLTATVAQETGAPWLSVHVVNDAEAMISRVCVTVSVSGLSPATYNGTVSIAGPKGLAPVVIPVALIIRHFL
ncbi:alkaline phosphatase family protein [Roseateles chitinivorans]|uniref:alkaline phosphatase family protein n=1 Tax=Roseateles chitinivorans TaxID=2917965 RepID=UPI003D67A458